MSPLKLVLLFQLAALVYPTLVLSPLPSPASSPSPARPPSSFAAEQRLRAWTALLSRKYDWPCFAEMRRLFSSLQSAGAPTVARWAAQQEKQINMDLHGRSRFPAEAQPQTDLMRSVLQAVAARGYPAIGYVQGMNLVAYHFMHMGLSAELVFRGLLYFIDEIGLDYYTPGMTGILRDSNLLATRLGLENSQVEALETLLFGWLPSFLSTASAAETKVIRLWDAILEDGREGWLAVLHRLLDHSECWDEVDLPERIICLKHHSDRTDPDCIVMAAQEDLWVLL